MIVTDEMVEQAAIKAWCSTEGDTLETWRGLGEVTRDDFRTYARTLLNYAATFGPSREERLTLYRCAALTGVMAGGEYWDGAGRGALIEDAAHDTLAAERPATEAPTVLDGLKDEMIAALERRVELLYAGIAEARDMLENSEAREAEVGRALGVLRGLLPKETP